MAVLFIKSKTAATVTKVRRRKLALKAKFAKVKNGIKTMGNAENVAKAARAAGKAATGLSKFITARKSDGSIDEKKVIGGVLDVVDSVASFLPPPASIITGTYIF